MKKLLLFFALGVCLQAQTTTVSATVTSQDGVPFAGSTYLVNLVNSTGGLLFLPPGNTYSGPRSFSGSLDSTGSFSLAVTPNASILAGSQWSFTIVPYTRQDILGMKQGIAPWTIYVTVAGSTQSLTAALSSVAPSVLLPGTGTGGTATLPTTNNLIKGNGIGGASVATPGVDYLSPSTGVSSVNGSVGAVSVPIFTPPAAGIVKSNGTSLSPAVAGTDYLNPATGVTSVNGSVGAVSTITAPAAGIVKSNGTALQSAVAGTDYLNPATGVTSVNGSVGAVTTITAPSAGIVKSTGSALATATAGTDYLTPSTGVTSVNGQTGAVTVSGGSGSLPTTAAAAGTYVPEAVSTGAATNTYTAALLYQLNTNGGGTTIPTVSGVPQVNVVRLPRIVATGTTSDSVVSTDYNKFIYYQNTGTTVVSVPNPASSGGAYAAGFPFTIRSVGGMSISSTASINGIVYTTGSPLSIAAAKSVDFISDGTNWWITSVGY